MPCNRTIKMNESPQINRDLYLAIRDFVNKRMGLFFTDSREKDLIRGLKNAAETFGYKDLKTCIEQLLSINWSPGQIQTLASYLTVGETFFFRHKEQIDYVFSEYLKNRYISRTIKIWSAACCSGEEPYTLAMYFKEKIPDIQSWDITILATDINPVFLKKARTGIYTEHSFRATPDYIKEKYFTKIDRNRFKIDDSLMDMVKFKYLNLAAQTYPSELNDVFNIDVIFCRNVFIYFNQEAVNKVVTNFSNSLNNNGILFVSPAETFMIQSDLLTKSPFSNPLFFTKLKPSKKVSPPQNSIDEILKELNSAKIKLKKEDKISTLIPKSEQYIKNAGKVTQNNISHDFSKEKQYLKSVFNQCRYQELIKEIELQNPSSLMVEDQKYILTLKGKSLANIGKLAESLKACESLIQLDRLDIDSYFLHASILIEIGEIDSAIIELNKILYLDNTHIMSHFMIANILRTKDRTEEANKHMQKALKFLRNEPPEKIIEESEGLTVNRMIEIITTLLKAQGIEL